MKTLLIIALLFPLWALAQHGAPFIEKVVQVKSRGNDPTMGFFQTSDESIYVPIGLESEMLDIDSVKYEVPWRQQRNFASMCVAKFNKNLEIDTVTFIDYDLLIFPYHNDDQYMWMGGHHITGYTSAHKIHMGKYTVNGEKIWTREIETDYYRTIRFNEKKKSFCFVAGFNYSWSYDSIKYTSRSNDYKIVTGRVDSLGGVNWVKQIYGNGESSLWGVKINEEDQVSLVVSHKCDTLFVGDTMLVCPFPKPGGTTQQIALLNISPSGKLVNFVHMYAKSFTMWTVGICNDKNWYSLLCYGGTLHVNQDSTTKQALSYNLVKWNESGKLEWVTSSNARMESYTILPNGNIATYYYLTKGQTGNIDGYTIKNPSDKGQTYLLLLDQNGKAIKHQPLGTSNKAPMYQQIFIHSDRINIFSYAIDTTCVEWYDSTYCSQIYYASFSYDLEKMEFKSLVEKPTKLVSSTIGAFGLDYDKERILGAFTLWDRDSIEFDGITYHAQKRWATEPAEQEDFMFLMNLNLQGKIPAGSPQLLTLDLSSLKVYPNPVINEVQFAFEGSGGQLKLFNTRGEMVMNEYICPSERYGVSHLPSGLYLVALKTKEASYIGKMIKE